MKEAYNKLADGSAASLVIADSFDKQEVERLESRFTADHNFVISKKEVITFNVKHSMQLDKPRIEKMISQLAIANMNKVVHRIFRNFLASGEQSKTYEDLGKTKDYICYVLKKKECSQVETAAKHHF